MAKKLFLFSFSENLFWTLIGSEIVADCFHLQMGHTGCTEFSNLIYFIGVDVYIHILLGLQ